MHGLDEDLADQRHEHRDTGQRGERQPDRPWCFTLLGVFRTGENLTVRLEREQQPQCVSDDQQNGEADAERLGELRGRSRIHLGDRRRHQQGDRGQEKQARLQARAGAVELLEVVLEPAEQKRGAQHEQRVGDDRAGDGGLHQRVLPGAQGGQCDDQLGQISQSGVEQPAGGVTRLGRNGFGRMAEQPGQRHDGKHRQDKERRVGFGSELRGGKHHRHSDQQP